MSFNGQKVLPAVRDVKDFEMMLESNYEYGVFLDIHISRLKSCYKLANQHNKKMFLHLDLVQGLKSDEFATEYICQEMKPYGIISTKGNVIMKAKQKKVKAIQRVFLLDSSSITKSFSLIERTKPDYIEVLPGLMTKVISEVSEKTNKEIITGGLISTVEEVEAAIEAGASAITTSDRELWKHFEPES
ncbi:glycerol-3-phosphate responsive antiterminator GlpP [Lottiidibacillus patelloidae]|uniref:Glycerol uptake operon antiterminator regulatory protein n=1 Tax=Lottiidibacillus patelloidae TaxID=2670334 RepID=A0A263BQE8_9BACI|nr:glycerol-3-phosphate responsive antiterminator [Lottiidibacillus patelloidae]OZM55798.1 glycerol-3-phosphate responsive antiterminator GlpP [Lottiidibacillus patelloidae]